MQLINESKIKNKTIRTLSKIWVTNTRYRWSKIRHHDSPKQLTNQQKDKYKQYIPLSLNGIQAISQILHKNFEYTNDSIDRLYDSIDSPASCWLRAMEKSPLKDDCDGFHSALYCVTQYNFNCKLLTVVTNDIRSSHTLLIIPYNNFYYYINYKYLSGQFDNYVNLIRHLEKRIYTSNIKIIGAEFSIFNNQWESTGEYISFI